MFIDLKHISHLLMIKLEGMMDDPRHGKSFVSLSDDEGTQFYKKRRFEYPYRRYIADEHNKPVLTIPVKDRKGETSQGYFLHNIQPRRIPLPADNRGGSKNYDPYIYPKGTSLDTRKDESDEKLAKNFCLV